MKILVLASSSFAAMNLPAALRVAGHDVWTFNRSLPEQPGSQDLHGGYQSLAEIATAALGTCDVLINYAIVKNGSIEQNVILADQIMAAARLLKVRRFVHVSSISVLPSITGELDEDAVAVEARWKGIYSRVKAAVEKHIIEEWRAAELNVVRPGFILGPGLVDSMVGTGKLLPTGQVLGLGNRRTVIMLIHRDTVDAAMVKMASKPLRDGLHRQNYMLVAPNAPRRKEYLDFQCRELGRGWSTLHFPAWLWRVGLFLGSGALSLLKRRQFRLVTLFEHNLNVRTYNCSRTARELGLDMSFDWKQSLRDLVHLRASPPWRPVPEDTAHAAPLASLGYFGMGRIVTQRHLPGLARAGFKGMLHWTDPAVREAPVRSGLNIAREPGILAHESHVVVTVPSGARQTVLEALSPHASHVLLEKPLAVNTPMLAKIKDLLRGRKAAVLHNYRFKPNMLQMRRHMARFPAGGLRAVSLHFETPSPANELSSWMKQEWKNRIVLTDYAMHYLDVCWMFCTGAMEIHRCLVSRNDRGELETLSAALSFDGVPCDILIRSGGHQRHAIISHHFQNYSTELRFFPEVFSAMTGGRSLIDDARLAWRGLTSTLGKVGEKLGLWTIDRSHDLVLAAFAGCGNRAPLEEVSVEALTPFYERLARLADQVYATKETTSPPEPNGS